MLECSEVHDRRFRSKVSTRDPSLQAMILFCFLTLLGLPFAPMEKRLIMVYNFEFRLAQALPGQD